MKQLKRMLLINWHYIKYQVIDFSQINFLTGKNGSGKSTIIDAMQLVLLGDTSGYFFNKAANDKSQRTLKGYLRGEIAEDEQTNTIYLREGDFSSYIVLEFTDQVSQESFCVGVIFDSYSDGDHGHQFFYLNAPLPANHFIVEGVELNRQGLKANLSNNFPKSKYGFFDTNGSYKEVLLAKLGQVNQKFFRLLKKAVPFSPIMDIKGFISDFVCDVDNSIDITDMQETIRYYKQWEQELEMVKKRLAVLGEVEKKYDSYQEEKQRYEMQSYLTDRAQEEVLQEEILNLLSEIQALEKKLTETTEEIKGKEEEINLLNKKKDYLFNKKINSNVYQRRQRLNEKIQQLENKRNEVKDGQRRLLTMAASYYFQWQEINEWLKNNYPSRMDLVEILETLKAIKGNNLDVLSIERLNQVKNVLQRALSFLAEQYVQEKNEYEELVKKVKLLEEQIEGLKKGIKAFPDGVIELQRLISEKLTEKFGKRIEPLIFANCLEIKNERWRNAIEGYLHTQKFYLLIEPEYFIDALKIYDEFKFVRKIYDIGLIDIEKVMTKNTILQANSLAEEVEADNPYARAYADFILGKVIKCEKVEHLRDYRIAITSSGMLYQNFVARQLHPSRFEVPYIGRNAILRQLEMKEEELKRSKTKLNTQEVHLDKLKELRSANILNDENIDNMLRLRDIILTLPDIENEWKRLTREFSSLDFTYLKQIDKALADVENEINFINSQIRQMEKSIGRFDEAKEEKEQRIPEIKKQIEERQIFIMGKYPFDWIEKIGEPRFLQEMEKRQDSKQIFTSFGHAVKSTQTRMDKKWKDLLEERINYNQEFAGAFNIQALDNEAYAEEKNKLENTHLVDYEERIRDAREKAQIQFKEDFISKLKSNIDDAREQIEDLNKALKDIAWGRDRYRFKVSPNQEYKKYYDMICDNLLMEGLTLFSDAFQKKYRDVVEELFNQIIDTGESLLTADKREILSKNLEKYTDYRTYLDFDLIVTDDEGRESRLSRVISKKSGGETQTPFYISVLASFAQLYRIKQQANNTARIIVFDEAYSKMDHQRIKESINLIRKLGLQVILSAPTEKIGDIAPLVDRNLCVTRIKNETIIRAFDSRELEEMGV
ncbi:MAG: AAA family ATPase [Clostridia bacterium]|nr:AAA family ATPase [Clostridia bacterium]